MFQDRVSDLATRGCGWALPKHVPESCEGSGDQRLRVGPVLANSGIQRGIWDQRLRVGPAQAPSKIQ
ncbi:hypothetical protein chiPu_0013233 [Chiloscyllium punctatum]|uniref:Uncharacterized protein n=1 Tax=Chiloscyllium punctatum TaxID=137246 RepID=A0A401SWH7_CHIPU|nr:hypothetical protein [Chiloscyllium punctatum]